MSYKLSLATLLAELPQAKLVGGALPESVRAVCYDSREVSRGALFCALPGTKVDGHNYAERAVAGGAAVLLVERELALDVPQISVDDVRRAMAKAAALFYDEPSRSIVTVGVTGTNGKTSMTYLVEGMVRAAGMAPGVIGTINYRYGGHVLPSRFSTPQAPDLQRLLAEIRSAGCDSVVMEASSHAIDQARIADVHFDVVAFTNLTQDHLDYHGDMESYYIAKRRLFREYIEASAKANKCSVINIDNEFGERLAAEAKGSVLTYSERSGADVYPLRVELDANGINAEVHTPNGRLLLHSQLIGQFNVQNILCAVGIATALGVERGAIAKGIADVSAIPGRLERVGIGLPFAVFVDYSHTEDSLQSALRALQSIHAKRIITIFGCGGDRDRSKRPLMGLAAARGSTLTIVTSDNPRTEQPNDIISEILPGVIKSGAQKIVDFNAASAGSFMVIPDRKAAIAATIANILPGDVLLVAGKGHEPYLEIGETRYPYSDIEECEKAIAAWKVRYNV